MAKLKYLPELKEVLFKIKTKFSNDGFEYVLNSLFKQNFLQVYEEFKQLDIELNKLSPKLANSIVFNFVRLEDLGRL